MTKDYIIEDNFYFQCRPSNLLFVVTAQYHGSTSNYKYNELSSTALTHSVR